MRLHHDLARPFEPRTSSVWSGMPNCSPRDQCKLGCYGLAASAKRQRCVLAPGPFAMAYACTKAVTMRSDESSTALMS
jgi:hypothetical protein